MTLQKWLVGFVLTTTMIIVLACAALLFSVRDFQYGLREVVPSGLVDMQRLDEVQTLIASQQGRVDGPRGEQLALEQRVATLDEEMNAIDRNRAEIAGDLSRLEVLAQMEPGEALDLSASALNARAAAVARQPSLDAEAQQQLASVRARIAQLDQQETDYASKQTERQRLAADQDRLASRLQEENRTVLALQSSVVGGADEATISHNYERVRREVQALRTMSPSGIGAMLAGGHPSMLSTALVLLMGALGAILYLFPAYLTRPEPVTYSEIIVRLIFGMCAALAFYVLANAAVAGISVADNVSQADTAAGLNPFTVSLVGVIAGVMAEDLAKWIRDRSSGVLTQGGSSAPPRAAAPAATAAPSDIGPRPGDSV